MQIGRHLGKPMTSQQTASAPEAQAAPDAPDIRRHGKHTDNTTDDDGNKRAPLPGIRRERLYRQQPGSAPAPGRPSGACRSAQYLHARRQGLAGYRNGRGRCPQARDPGGGHARGGDRLLSGRIPWRPVPILRRSTIRPPATSAQRRRRPGSNRSSTSAVWCHPMRTAASALPPAYRRPAAPLPGAG